MERQASLWWLSWKGGQGLVTQELELRAMCSAAMSIQPFDPTYL